VCSNKVQIKLSQLNSYNILFSQKFSQFQKKISTSLVDREVYIITNDIVRDLYLESFTRTCELCSVIKLNTFILNDGEEYKNHQEYLNICKDLIEKKYSRLSTTIIALGGGVVGDISGFVASSYQRGVDFIQIPTTLLSQVDSSLGGKTAINFAGVKNMLGSFYYPHIVYIASDFLETLSDRDFISGLGEVVKYALIDNDNFYTWLVSNSKLILEKDLNTLQKLIYKCCQIKNKFVRNDFADTKGQRALLNFGHSFAHTIESLKNYTGFRHGEAVGLGILIESYLSYKLDFISYDEYQKIFDLVKIFKLPLSLGEKYAVDDFLLSLKLDKKNIGENINIVLLNSIGNAEVKEVELNFIKNFLENDFDCFFE